MAPAFQRLDLKQLRVYPLRERHSLSKLEDILVDPESPAPACPAPLLEQIGECAQRMRAARERGAGVVMLYGAHLVKNGGMRLMGRLLTQGWVTHLATNGAGTIHDWEFAFQGWSTESVRANVATGTFGAWDDTGRNLHLALLAGGLEAMGYGAALGRFITEDGAELPAAADLEEALRRDPAHWLSPARAELLVAMRQHELAEGRHRVEHPWKQHSILAQAWKCQVPRTGDPGSGYDIISNHPMFNGAAIGRAAALDFAVFGRSVDTLDGGVVLSVGSAIMAPQVFEKSLSCVNNLRLQSHRPTVRDHCIHVVDLQDGGQWDWTAGEPPKDNPAYYLRFCKSFARMGGAMHYLQCDNILFLHHLWDQLRTAR